MFRVNNVSKNILYYTIILDKDQIKETRDDTRVMIKRREVNPKFKRQCEQFIYNRETGKWESVTTFY